MLFYLGLIGLIVSIYAIYVEMKTLGGALCDLSNRASCSKVLKSEYARLAKIFLNLRADHPLNIPNTYFGVIFYLMVMLFDFVNIPFKEVFLFIASSFSFSVCIILGYVLYFILYDFCIVCVTTYIINILIFTQAYILNMDSNLIYPLCFIFIFFIGGVPFYGILEINKHHSKKA